MGGQLLFRSPLSLPFFLVLRFPLEQFFFGHAQHLAHRIVEPLKLSLSGNVWRWQRFHSPIIPPVSLNFRRALLRRRQKWRTGWSGIGWTGISTRNRWRFSSRSTYPRRKNVYNSSERFIENSMHVAAPTAMVRTVSKVSCKPSFIDFSSGGMFLQSQRTNESAS